MKSEAYPPGALERLQNEQTIMLGLVATLCAEFDLTWFVDGGTFLGAVRHKGFIPWDDDIDIALPLDDYMAFCRIAPSVFAGSGYGVYLPNETPNYAPFWAKIYKEGTRFIDEPAAEAGFEQGIFIDVFPYVQLDSNQKKAAKQAKAAAFWQRMSYIYHIRHPHIPSTTPAKPLVRAALAGAHQITHLCKSPDAFYRQHWRALMDGDGKGAWANTGYTLAGCFDTKTLFPPATYAFGNQEVPGPNDAHSCLTTKYGDYMSLPPESQRYTHRPIVLDFGDGINVVEQRLSGTKAAPSITSNSESEPRIMKRMAADER